MHGWHDVAVIHIVLGLGKERDVERTRQGIAGRHWYLAIVEAGAGPERGDPPNRRSVWPVVAAGANAKIGLDEILPVHGERHVGHEVRAWWQKLVVVLRVHQDSARQLPRNLDAG